MDRIEEDLKQSRVNNWKTKTANRMEWKSIAGTVKAGTRLIVPIGINYRQPQRHYVLHVVVLWTIMRHKIQEFLKTKVKEEIFKYLNALLLVLYNPVLYAC
jgi:hypothetical protein